MFKKSKRNIRVRKADSDSDEDNKTNNANPTANVGPQIQPATAPVSAVQQPASAKPAASNKQTISNDSSKGNSMSKVVSAGSVLSFEMDEDVFQIKKSSHNRNIVHQLRKETKDEQMKKTLKQKSNQKNQGKPPSKESKQVTISDEDDEPDADSSKSKPLVPSVQDILKSGAIPDANLIHLARKKRQMARECGGEEFIPIDDTQRYEKCNSRLIRDDDNDASDSDEDTNVLAITLKQKDMQRRKIEEKILAAEEDSESDHEKQWEEQQIKKGTNIPAQVIVNNSGSCSTLAGSNNSSHLSQHHIYLLSHYASASFNPFDNMNYTINNSSGNNNNMTALDRAEMEARISASQSKKVKSLEEQLVDLKDRQRSNRRDKDESRDTISNTLSSVLAAKNGIVDVEEQYKFFQDMRAFVKDYVECMNEKMTSINYLDRCMMDLLRQRAEKLVSRRQEDVKDQSIEYAFGKATASTTAAATANAAAAAAESQSTDDAARKRRKAERDGRRARRKREREKKGIKDHKDGMSTDDEQINSEVAKFNTEKERLTNDIKTAFDDVVDEFCNIPQIISKIERWKKEQNDSYVQAYIGLCLPRFLTPLIKVQLAVWNPLEQYCRNFEKLPWYQDLLNYGTIKENSINKSVTESKSLEKPISQNSNNNDVTVNGDDLSSTTTTTTTAAAAAATTTTTSTANDKNGDNNDNDVNGRGKMGDDDAGDEEDMDIKLIPNIVDKLLLPRINGLVESVWDPMSLQQTTNLSNVIKQVTVDYPIEAAQSKSLQSLICSINKRIMKSINDDLFIPLYPKSVLENKTSESTMFFNRQVYSCLKLMKSIVLWQNVISDQQLQSLTLDKILNRYLMIAMSGAPANIELISLCQKISQLIPQEWFTEYMEGITLPQLENFCKFIVTWATNLKTQMKSNSDAKEQIKQLGRILLRLHAEAHATALSKLIGFKITIN